MLDFSFVPELAGFTSILHLVIFSKVILHHFVALHQVMVF